MSVNYRLEKSVPGSVCGCFMILNLFCRSWVERYNTQCKMWAYILEFETEPLYPPKTIINANYRCLLLACTDIRLQKNCHILAERFLQIVNVLTSSRTTRERNLQGWGRLRNVVVETCLGVINGELSIEVGYEVGFWWVSISYPQVGKLHSLCLFMIDYTETKSEQNINLIRSSQLL
jgi:hypothetical protein